MYTEVVEKNPDIFKIKKNWRPKINQKLLLCAKIFAQKFYLKKNRPKADFRFKTFWMKKMVFIFEWKSKQVFNVFFSTAKKLSIWVRSISKWLRSPYFLVYQKTNDLIYFWKIQWTICEKKVNGKFKMKIRRKWVNFSRNSTQNQLISTGWSNLKFKKIVFFSSKLRALCNPAQKHQFSHLDA